MFVIHAKYQMLDFSLYLVNFKIKMYSIQKKHINRKLYFKILYIYLH